MRPTVRLTAAEIGALLHEPGSAPEVDTATVEMIPLIDDTEPSRLARGSDAIRPRRTRVALSVADILGTGADPRTK